MAVIVLNSDQPDGTVISDSSLPLHVPGTTTTVPMSTTSTQLIPVDDVARSPLNSFVPDLEGQLVTLQGQNTMLLIARNAENANAVITVMPGGWVSNVSFEASGELIGFTNLIGEAEYLYFGDETQMTDTRFVVTSYVWHGIRPAEVAAVFVNDDKTSWNLNTFGINPERQITNQSHIVGFDSPRTVRAWTDTGFVLRGFNDEEATPFVEFIDLSGEVVWRLDGELLDVSSTGDVLISTGVDESRETRLVHADDTNGGSGEVLDWVPVWFSDVRWSTRGQMIAVSAYAGPDPGDWGLQVYLPDGTLLHSAVVPWRFWDIQWSPDDKYVLMPGTDDQGTHAVIFYNRHTEQLSAVDDLQDWVQWSDLRPESDG